MKFQIRAHDAGDRHKEKIYYKHLLKNKTFIPKALWQYFSNDFFFHDGHISEFHMSNGFSEITLKIKSPNIKFLKTNNGYDFVITEFKCSFSGIYSFEIERLILDKIETCPLSVSTQFISSEIDTVTSIKKIRGMGQDCNSLLLHICNGNHNSIIMIVFEEVCISPCEPLAFMSIKNDRRFVIPEPL